MEEIRKQNLDYIEVHPQNIQRAAYLLVENLRTDRFRIVDNKRLLVYDSRASVQELTRLFTEGGVLLDFIGQKAETLEDYFLKMTENTENGKGEVSCGN